MVAPSTFKVLSKSAAPVTPKVLRLACPDTFALAPFIFPDTFTKPVTVVLPAAKVLVNDELSATVIES